MQKAEERTEASHLLSPGMQLVWQGPAQKTHWTLNRDLGQWNLMHQFSSVAQSCLTLWEPINRKHVKASHIHWVSDTIQPFHPLSSLLLLPSIFSSIRVFSDESALCIRKPKYWSFSLNISPSDEHTGLISFRIDWLDLHVVVQGTLKSFVQHHSSKASILQRSTFFII